MPLQVKMTLSKSSIQCVIYLHSEFLPNPIIVPVLPIKFSLASALLGSLMYFTVACFGIEEYKRTNAMSFLVIVRSYFS